MNDLIINKKVYFKYNGSSIVCNVNNKTDYLQYTEKGLKDMITKLKENEGIIDTNIINTNNLSLSLLFNDRISIMETDYEQGENDGDFCTTIDDIMIEKKYSIKVLGIRNIRREFIKFYQDLLDSKKYVDIYKGE